MILIKVDKIDYYTWKAGAIILLILLLSLIMYGGNHQLYLREMNITSDYTANEVAVKVPFAYHSDLIILNDDFESVPYHYYDNNLWIQTNLTNSTNKFGLIYSK